MKPFKLAFSLVVADIQRTLEFYRDGLGLEVDEPVHGAITLYMPNVTLFFIEANDFYVYSRMVGSVPYVDATNSQCIVSCIVGSREELNDVITRASLVGGSAEHPPQERNGNYVGYFKDPDGHIWELAVEVAAASL